MTRKFNLFLLVMALVLGGPYYWFLLDNSHADAPAKRLDITELRRLAASVPGAAPSAVYMERSAFRRVPGNLMVAGSGIKRKLVGHMGFLLTVPGGKPIVIDSGITAKVAADLQVEYFDVQSQGRIYRAMDGAGLILVTHEHGDHMAALVSRGGDALGRAAWLSQAQLPPSELAARLDWSGRQVPLARLSGNGPQAVAPGVVVIPAADSHTPGSQLVYVRLDSGREYLFVGDLASFAQNWQEQRGRSRLVETWFAPQNRAEVFAWLAAIQALHRAAPGLIVVSGHDTEWIENSDNKTGILGGFPT